MTLPFWISACDDALDQIAGDGEADAGTAARLAQNLRVDADDFAMQVDQRATAVAGVDRRVGLDDRADLELTEAVNRAIQRADDTRRQRPGLVERAADGDDFFADEQRCPSRRVSTGCSSIAGRSTWITARSESGSTPTTVAAIDAAVEEVDFDAGRAVDDVIIGDNMPLVSMTKPVPVPSAQA